MLRIKTNPKKSPAKDVTFENISALTQTGIDMLIAVNMTPNTLVTGPEVGIDSKILVTKATPHFFFNPKCLQNNTKDSTIVINYTNIHGEETEITMLDEDGSIWQAIDHLHNGIKRANKKRI